MQDHDTRHLLATRMRARSVIAGHDVCREGDEADCLWILQASFVPCVGLFNKSMDFLEPL